MKRSFVCLVAVLILASVLLSSCSPLKSVYSNEGSQFALGYGESEIDLPKNSKAPLYIAGYQNGEEIESVLDLPKAKAVWIDTSGKGILLIGIDCVGVSSGTVARIRDELAVFCRKNGCVSVNVYATHTHAGVDTMGLWGPVAINGKNSDYIDNLVVAAVSAAKEAYCDRSFGELYYGSAVTYGLLEDSREPFEYDSSVHQIRFESASSDKNGVRLISFAAHAESLRGDNRALSADFPAPLSENIKSATGDDVMYLPSAVGGLIMTKVQTKPFDALLNMNETAKLLSHYVLSISNEEKITPSLAISRVKLEIPLDNTYFFFAKFLGILDNGVKRKWGGYVIESELSVLCLGDITLALIPGEIFPELVSGVGLKEGDAEALEKTADRKSVV